MASHPHAASYFPQPPSHLLCLPVSHVLCALCVHAQAFVALCCYAASTWRETRLGEYLAYEASLDCLFVKTAVVQHRRPRRGRQHARASQRACEWRGARVGGRGVWMEVIVWHDSTTCLQASSSLSPSLPLNADLYDSTTCLQASSSLSPSVCLPPLLRGAGEGEGGRGKGAAPASLK